MFIDGFLTAIVWCCISVILSAVLFCFVSFIIYIIKRGIEDVKEWRKK